MKQHIHWLDKHIIRLSSHSFIPAARIGLFLVFFWFGFLKFFDGISPAQPLAEAMVARTVGAQYFDVLFPALAMLECLIGVLFLFPKATRIVLPLLAAHMATVIAPLFLLPSIAWSGFLVPTLEGQYIIKNLVVIAVGIGIAARTEPLVHKSKPGKKQ